VFLVSWPDQKIYKEVHGVRRLVTVIGGRADFVTLPAALRYAEGLLEFWPGLIYSLEEVNGSKPPDALEAEGLLSECLRREKARTRRNNLRGKVLSGG